MKTIVHNIISKQDQAEETTSKIKGMIKEILHADSHRNVKNL
jgi:hypothetical protein